VLNKTNTNKITAAIFVLPPIILLIYAVILYFAFFNSQVNSNKHIYEKSKTVLLDISLNELKSKANTVNNFINSEKNLKYVESFLKSIDTSDSKNIVVLNKNNKIIFKTKNIEKPLIDKIEKIKNIYQDDNLQIYKIDKNRLKWKIVTFTDTSSNQKYLNSIQEALKTSSKQTIKKGLIWLVVSWFILLGFSLWLAIKVFNQLKNYESKIRKNNENIIFQSRQALLGELLPMIAHQWRQPINKIAAVLMRMRFELGNGSPNVSTLDRQAQQIEDSVELMSNTIDDFRTFYRPKEQAENVDVSLLIRKAFYFLDELLGRKKIKVKNDLFTSYAELHANEFLQVMIKLIKNATDAVDMQGEISVSMREIGSDIIEIRIEDDGTGIPQDKLEKIFEPHESSKQGSMGLGLYMSKLIIESHLGGVIKAYNTSRGAGFLIRIPKRQSK